MAVKVGNKFDETVSSGLILVRLLLMKWVITEKAFVEVLMKRIIALGLFIIFGFFCEAQAQSLSTRVIRIEIDGKEVQKHYKVFFLNCSDDKWIEAEKTSTGFIVPTKFKNEEYVQVLITLGKYRLEFPEIHNSKFKTGWVIGVDNEPFSEEYVRPRDVQRTKRAYYIKFQGVGLDTVLVFTEWKNK